MGQIIKVQRPLSPAPISGLYHRPLLAACIISLYHRPVCDIRGRIYNSVAGGIIVQIVLGHLYTMPLIPVISDLISLVAMNSYLLLLREVTFTKTLVH